MSSWGYSFMVGRVNIFRKSFLFVVRRIIGELVDDLLGVDLIASNAAIGGIPSFLYGWCPPNFLGEDSDLVLWGYGKSPMIMVLENKGPRMDLLQ